MPEILIVGAGVAGLAAGRELLRVGQHPLVLEARDRIGGRILTHRDPLSPLPIELGAEMVHGLHPDLWSVLRESVALPVEMDGEHLPEGDFEDVDAVFEKMAQAPEQSFASFLASVEAPPHVKNAATGFVEGFNAADKNDVSIEWLNLENKASEQTGGERAFRLANGYDSVPAHLSHGVNLRLSTEVQRIYQTADGTWSVKTSRGPLSADRVILALPFSILRSGAVTIDPEPPALQGALDAVVTGEAIRVTFRFREAPWEKHRRLSFLHSNQALPVWWTYYPMRVPLITGWAAGPKAEALRGRSRDDLVHTALASLRAILKEDIDAPEAAYFHDWCSDPYSRGAYSYVKAGGMAAQAALTEPFRNSLFFAGEATDTAGHMGTVHGAIATGIRAARLLMKGLA